MIYGVRSPKGLCENRENLVRETDRERYKRDIRPRCRRNRSRGIICIDGVKYFLLFPADFARKHHAIYYNVIITSIPPRGAQISDSERFYFSFFYLVSFSFYAERIQINVSILYLHALYCDNTTARGNVNKDKHRKEKRTDIMYEYPITPFICSTERGLGNTILYILYSLWCRT